MLDTITRLGENQIMKVKDIQIGKRYRNPRVENLIGSKVVYLGVGEARGPKNLVIIEGVGSGAFVCPPNDVPSKAFWGNVVAEDSLNTNSVASQVSAVLGQGANKKNGRKLVAIRDNTKLNPVVRRTAFRLLQEIR